MARTIQNIGANKYRKLSPKGLKNNAWTQPKTMLTYEVRRSFVGRFRILDTKGKGLLPPAPSTLGFSFRPFVGCRLRGANFYKILGECCVKRKMLATRWILAPMCRRPLEKSIRKRCRTSAATRSKTRTPASSLARRATSIHIFFGVNLKQLSVAKGFLFKLLLYMYTVYII